MFYITFRAQTEYASGAVLIATKPLTVEGCTYNFETTVSNITITQEIMQHGKSLHNLSYLYYTGFGALITCVVAVLSSFLFGFRDPKTVDHSLLAPFMRKYFDNKSLKKKDMANNDQESADELDTLKPASK